MYKLPFGLVQIWRQTMYFYVYHENKITIADKAGKTTWKWKKQGTKFMEIKSKLAFWNILLVAQLFRKKQIKLKYEVTMLRHT